jgi:hypothetical protein
MPVNYSAPDVYVEEVPGGARPVQAVGTSIAGFIGKAPDGRLRINEAVPITSWSAFMNNYVKDNSTSTPLSHAVYGFFQNGGSMCYVVNTGNGPLSDALDALARIDEIAIIAAPGMTDASSYDEILTYCENMRDRIAVLDAPESVSDVQNLTEVAGLSSSRRSSSSSDSESDEDSSSSSSSSSSSRRSGGLRPRQSDGGFGAVYYPWIKARDPLNPSQIINVPPSGHMAGIWARTDATRGVHKAPANESIRGALDVVHRLTRPEHGILNDAGVNAIRFYSREGVRVMGARTLDDPSGEYRYLPVRRTVTMIEESIEQSMRWVIFEPNDQTLWQKIRRDVTAFLTRIWRDGALMGSTPEEAFFVKCDAETNPQENIDAGIVTTVIGLAPVKPAEFVVFRLSQFQPGGDMG